MPYPKQMMLFSWGGNVRGSGTPGQIIEAFTGSMKFGYEVSAEELGLVDTDDACVQLTEDLRTFWQNPDAQIPGAYRIEWVKWNRIDEDGHYVNEATRGIYNLNYDGGAGSLVYPLQVSWATTWMTDKTRGLANKGRTYWPTRATIYTNDMLVLEDTCRKMADAAQTLINNWGNWQGLDTTTVAPVIASKTRAGAQEKITTVGVGRRLDILRSRAAQQYETKYVGPTSTA